MPYYSDPPHSQLTPAYQGYPAHPAYPANQGVPASEEYDSPLEPGLHVTHAFLNDADAMAQDLSTVHFSHSFEAEPNPTIKMEPDPAFEEFSSLVLSLESFMSSSGLGADNIDHAFIWPTPLLLNSFSSESGQDMMGKTGSYCLGEVDLDQQLYRTSYQTLEKDEQDFSNTAGAIRMMQTTLIPDASRLQSPIGDQQLDGMTYEDYNGDGDEGDNMMLLMMEDQMESEEEGEGMMGNQEEVMKVEEEEEEEEVEEKEQAEEEEDEPIYLLRQRLLEQRIRNPEPNWGPYRPSNETLASMRDYVQALRNKVSLSRAGWSDKLLEDLFGSKYTLTCNQWPLPRYLSSPSPPPTSN